MRTPVRRWVLLSFATASCGSLTAPDVAPPLALEEAVPSVAFVSDAGVAVVEPSTVATASADRARSEATPPVLSVAANQKESAELDAGLPSLDVGSDAAPSAQLPSDAGDANGVDVLYDDGETQCTVGSVTMHCCPSGYAMSGALVHDNIFKCTVVAAAGPPFLDEGTVRNDMHACPAGAVMIGLREDENRLACQRLSDSPSDEYVDGQPPTLDAFPMHVCAEGHVMTGIHVADDLWSCARAAR